MLDHLFSRIPADATFTSFYCRPIAGILPIAWLLSASRAEMSGAIAPNTILATPQPDIALTKDMPDQKVAGFETRRSRGGQRGDRRDTVLVGTKHMP